MEEVSTHTDMSDNLREKRRTLKFRGLDIYETVNKDDLNVSFTI